MSTADSFANGTSSVYIDQMYEEWRHDPQSVHASWRSYFANVEAGSSTPYQAPPNVGATGGAGAGANLDEIVAALAARGVGGSSAGASTLEVKKAQSDAMKIMQLVRAFMTHGHISSDVDPLELEKTYEEAGVGKKFAPGSRLKELIDPAFYGFGQADLDREFYVDVDGMGGILGKQKNWKLRDLIEALKTAYCGKVGVEFMHIPDRE
jgi:2-oxoglutarate dehydrogenase E1 component